MTLKGTLLGIVLLFVLTIVYAKLTRFPVGPQTPVQGPVSYDLHTMIRTLRGYTVEDPMWWVVFVVCARAGTVLAAQDCILPFARVVERTYSCDLAST